LALRSEKRNLQDQLDNAVDAHARAEKEKAELSTKLTTGRAECDDMERTISELKDDLSRARSNNPRADLVALEAALTKERQKSVEYKKALETEIANHRDEIAEIESGWEAEVKKLKEKIRQGSE
jgi:predicted  nucleic acid-binding Zn-ribbon protein